MFSSLWRHRNRRLITPLSYICGHLATLQLRYFLPVRAKTRVLPRHTHAFLLAAAHRSDTDSTNALPTNVRSRKRTAGRKRAHQRSRCAVRMAYTSGLLLIAAVYMSCGCTWRATPAQKNTVFLDENQTRRRSLSPRPST